MLDFLKKIFQAEELEVKKITEISLQNLEEWVIEKSKPLTEELKQQIDEILMKVDEEVQRARFNVEVLENAKLQNPNIPFKAKQYMEGNRKAYMRSINSFIGHMEINNRDYFYLVGFCEEFERMLNELNKGTLRSYTILQEFFANEAGRIAQNLKNFDTLFANLKSILNDKKIAAVNNLKDEIQNLRIRTKQKINLDIDFKNMKATLELANSEKESLLLEILNFNKSEEHSNFLKLADERRNKEKNFYEEQNQILQSFSVLERPLRKYSHIAFEHEEIILDYLKNPIETLVNDKELKILEILGNLEKMLDEGRIKIDDKKMEKSLEEIKKLNRGFMEQFIKKYLSFKTELEELDNKIKATGVADKFRNFNKNLEEINLKIEKTNEEHQKLKDDVVKTDNLIMNLKNSIYNSIKNSFGEDTRIIV